MSAEIPQRAGAAATPARPVALPGWLRWRGSGPLLPLLAVAVVLVVASPLVFLALKASESGWAEARQLLGRPLVATLLQHTVSLVAAVTAAALVIGFSAAWLVERTDLPLRRTWTVLLTMPLAVPEFVRGYSWVSLFTGVRGYWGAVLVMTTSLYPLVFLPVAAALRGGDPAAEEVSRSLGRGRLATLWRVTLPLTRPALAGGALLVSLYLLGEYGAFAMMRYTTFATAIFTEYQLGFDAVSAAMLTLALVALALLLVGLEGRVGRRGRVVREGATGRRGVPQPLGGWRWPAFGWLTAVVAVAVGVPVYALGYWLVVGSSTTLPSASILDATGTTLGYALSTGAVTTACAVPVALYSWRRASRLSRVLERTAYLTRALPGIAVALAVVFFAIRYAQPFYEQPAMLVVGYVVLFFPLALTAVRAALAQVPPGVEEVARSLGTRPLLVLWRVTLPLILPGLGAAFAMVALTASTELTATLLLRPTGTQTLATQFWVYTSGLAYGAAAPYAAVMTALSVPPVLLLTRRTFGSKEI
ncbi:ABC transporter permease [Kitasatospora viridis]|uniref:Iron(III) transport system permease protein n=1 Tax=Kitasatospora viridis TaxID=281105 RepID=A0A561UNT4_9ACTN|nr:iron ABC transporter permease [Kitasatospora viridis]TWG01011.1 iron(III) transport system permease protein [Kitasatospora viridis]